MNLSRRGFIKSSVVAGTALALPAVSYGRVMGTNERIRAAVVGLHGRGGDHYNGLKDNVVALCDVATTVATAASDWSWSGGLPGDANAWHSAQLY